MYKEFKKFGRMLFDQGLNNSHSGNMSVRKGATIIITRHGAKLSDIEKNSLVTVNLNNTTKDKDASVEVIVHRAIYQTCPGVNAIVHAHNPHGIVLSLNQKEITPIDMEGSYYIDMIPVLECKVAIASCEVAQRLPALIQKHKVAMVKGHGVFAGGKTLEEATMLASVAESVSKIIYLDKIFRFCRKS